MRTAHPSRPVIEVEPETPALEVTGLRVSYGGVKAVRDVSLRVMRGEVMALVGANGAGKSSLLRATARLVPLAGGLVRLRGESLAGVTPEEAVARGLSYVPEGRGALASLTVGENLRVGAFTHRDRQAMGETQEDVLTLFPALASLLDRRAGALSGGEQRMLAIGRALMARPSVLLLDEPSLGLAPRLVRAIFDAVTRVADDGVAVLLVEQNTRLALAVSQRACVMRSGEVVLQGDAWELARDPDVQAAYLGG